MTLAMVRSRAARGLEAIPVNVEVYVGAGLPKFVIVGLPEKEVCESQHRVRAVLLNSCFEFPCQRIIVNLAPADLPKEGGRFDLPIALGILVAGKQLPPKVVADYEFIGELGLSGTLRPVRGVLPAVVAAARQKRKIVIPQKNCVEASLVHDAEIYPADNLLRVCEHLLGHRVLKALAPAEISDSDMVYPDLSDIRGQYHAIRALEVAAAGNHNCLFMGAPGTGKTMLASRLPGILPPLNHSDALEVTILRSLDGKQVKPQQFYQRPFRSPHHSASAAALVGGGADLRLGEVTRAHHGVLFLDELPEFQRRALETLREPLESHSVRLSRVAGHIEYPARFQMIAAMNPCPDGSDVDENGACPCSDARLQRYYSRLSVPFLDRIDMHVRVPRISWGKGEVKQCEPSVVVRQRVLAAYQRQIKRQDRQNAYIDNAQIEKHCGLSKQDKTLFFQAVERLNLSARAVHRTLKVARTIADLSASELITRRHLLEALSYRAMDKLFKV